MKNPAPKKLVKVAGFVCTPNHPIFTKEDNYAEAQEISGKTLYILRKEVHGLRKRENHRKILLQILRILRLCTRDQQESGRKATQTIGKKSMSSVWKSENTLPV